MKGPGNFRVQFYCLRNVSFCFLERIPFRDTPGQRRNCGGIPAFCRRSEYNGVRSRIFFIFFHTLNIATIAKNAMKFTESRSGVALGRARKGQLIP